MRQEKQEEDKRSIGSSETSKDEKKTIVADFGRETYRAKGRQEKQKVDSKAERRHTEQKGDKRSRRETTQQERDK